MVVRLELHDLCAERWASSQVRRRTGSVDLSSLPADYFAPMPSRYRLPKWRSTTANFAAFIGFTSLSPLVLSSAGCFPLAGIVDASLLSKVLRILTVALFFVCCIPLKPGRVGVSVLSALFGAGIAVLMYFARPESLDPLDTLFWNGLAYIAITALLIGSYSGCGRLGWEGLDVAVCVGALLSFGLYTCGCYQSDNGGWVGGTGNANSFGFLCLMVFYRVLFDTAASWWRASVAFLATVGVFGSGSLFCFLGLLFALSYGVVMGRSIVRRRIFLLLGAGTIAIVSLLVIDGISVAEPVHHMMLKLRSTMALLMNDTTIDLSRSVELRNAIWRDIISDFAESPESLLIGGLGGYRYFALDSQLLTYVASFGFPVAAAMLAPIGAAILRLCKADSRQPAFECQLLLAIAFLLVNRCLDYFTAGVAIAMLIAQVRGCSASIVRTERTIS